MTKVEIIVNDKPIRIYRHNFKNYVEGRKGSEFSIKISNTSGNKILAIPSVDGISVLDGKEASSNSIGFVIRPYSNIVIPGWKLNSNEVAKFIFESKENSYAELNDDVESSNTGVIGVLFYEEKYDTRTRVINRVSDSYIKSLPSTSMYSFSLCAASFQPEVKEEDEQMGTGFGDSTEFKTRTVDFERGNEIGRTVIYYDSKKNLIKKGIINEDSNEPNPFPGDDTGCKPPKNWVK